MQNIRTLWISFSSYPELSELKLKNISCSAVYLNINQEAMKVIQRETEQMWCVSTGYRCLPIWLCSVKLPQPPNTRLKKIISQASNHAGFLLILPLNAFLMWSNRFPN